MKTRHFFTIVLLVGVSLLTLLVPGEGKPSVALAERASVPAPRAMDISRRDAAADSNVVYVCSSSDIGRTNDISAQSPHWTKISRHLWLERSTIAFLIPGSRKRRCGPSAPAESGKARI